jgi:hypothetical protein
MKKLALALVCLASVAFFASCDPTEGQPTIQVLQDQDVRYVQDGETVNVGEEINFGFVMASSTITNKELSSLIVKIDDDPILTDTVDLTGSYNYTYKSSIEYVAKDEIIGTSVITAIVTDAAGETATATIKLTINQPDQPLETSDLKWVRKGLNLIDGTEEAMASVGLKWPGNQKEVFAIIEPLNDDVQLYVLQDQGEKFDEIETSSEKNAFFTNLAETATPAQDYRHVSAFVPKDYNDILAVVYGEDLFLIRINRADIETGSYGTQITINGELK